MHLQSGVLVLHLRSSQCPLLLPKIFQNFRLAKNMQIMHSYLRFLVLVLYQPEDHPVSFGFSNSSSFLGLVVLKVCALCVIVQNVARAFDGLPLIAIFHYWSINSAYALAFKNAYFRVLKDYNYFYH